MNKAEAREAAKVYLETNPSGVWLRSCWNCNEAHERLKQSEYVIICFSCGHWFYQGVDITEEKSEK